MDERIRRGRLREPGGAPATGESIECLLAFGNAEVRQILSGSLDRASEFVQDEDEWVVLLAGRARLIVAGESLELSPGDWLYLPAGVPHSVVETERGTSWLALHLFPPGDGRWVRPTRTPD